MIRKPPFLPIFFANHSFQPLVCGDFAVHYSRRGLVKASLSSERTVKAEEFSILDAIIGVKIEKKEIKITIILDSLTNQYAVKWGAWAFLPREIVFSSGDLRRAESRYIFYHKITRKM